MRGQSEEQVAKFREEYSQIKVIPLDMDKFNADIDTNVKKAIEAKQVELKMEEGKTANDYIFSQRGYMGMCFIPGTNLLIDRECCGEYLDKDEKIVIEVYRDTKPDENGSQGIGMFPVLNTTMTKTELLEKYGMPEIDLPTYMGSRFNYNSRIVSNMQGIMEEVKKQTKKAKK